MVTDRRIVAGEEGPALVTAVAAAAERGVHLVQIRERDLEARSLLPLVRECLRVVRGTRTRIVVNDRLDVALAAGAHGVHLRETSIPAARVRQVCPPGFLIGRSVHDVPDARDVDGADYLLFGHVFETASKPGVPGRGIAMLRDVANATPVPVLAIGGITDDRVATVMAAGAGGVAGISMFCPSRPFASARDAGGAHC